MGLFAIVGVGALSHHAEASTGLQSQNEAVVGRWFTEFWGKTYNPMVVNDLRHRTCCSSILCTSLDVVAKTSTH